MARRRYYRSRRTIPKQKWLLNMMTTGINSVSAQTTSIGSGLSYFNQSVIINNINNPVTSGAAGSGFQNSNATILKTGRWKCKGVITAGSEVLNYLIGIAYIPEGYDVSTNVTSDFSMFPYKHPEWLLAWKRFDYTNASQSNEFSLSSRLKRNLNAGDKVILFMIANNPSANPVTINANVPLLRATITYVCRAN